MNIERRMIPTAIGAMAIEKRADGGDTISGYGAVFYDANDPGTEYELYPGLCERVLPGAFDRCISERQDIRGLFNHSPDHILGRTASGTMRLSIDKRGLRYEIDLPATQSGRDVAEMIRRGDVTGSSFSFMPVRQNFVYCMGDEEDDIRELQDVDVFDCGPVVFPAYASATAGIRMAGDIAEVRSACDLAMRGAIRFQGGPLIDDDNWDQDAAMARVKAWASEGDRMNHRKLARAFAFSDGTASEAGHKLLHHDVRDGKLHVHRGAVTRCLRDLDLIPEDERDACKSHLERHRSWNDESDDDGDEMERMRMRTRLAEVC